MTQNFWCTCEADIPAGWGKLQSSALSAQTVSLTLSYRQAQSEQKSIILLGGRQISLRWALPMHTTPALPPTLGCWRANLRFSLLSVVLGCYCSETEALHAFLRKSTTLIVDRFPLSRWLCCDVPSWTALMWRDDISQTSPSAGKLWDPSKQHLIS